MCTPLIGRDAFLQVRTLYANDDTLLLAPGARFAAMIGGPVAATKGGAWMDEHETSIEVRDASGSRSPNGQHVFGTQVGGVQVFTPAGDWNPALAIEVVEEGSMIRHANGAWQAAGWRLRVRGIPASSAITTGRMRP